MALASYTPTQIGSTALPFTSFRTTIGMFVTGSIIRPRIFISTSIAALPSRRDQVLTHQAIRTSPCDANVYIFSQKGFARRSDIYDPVARCATGPLIFAARGALDEHFGHAADQRLVALLLNGPLAFL